MCGIVGQFRTDGNHLEKSLIENMCTALRHRGPDDQGFFFDGPVGLGMRRLSVIDLDGGQQPMSNEDGTLQVIFNGEIYNYQDLRQELLSNGHDLNTQSDTEVIVHLYEDYGLDCFSKLDGMFTIAIWDTRKEELVLARDKFGKKPLFYAKTDQGLSFSS